MDSFRLICVEVKLFLSVPTLSDVVDKKPHQNFFLWSYKFASRCEEFCSKHLKTEHLPFSSRYFHDVKAFDLVRQLHQ